MSTIQSSREIDTIFREATRAGHTDVIALVRRTPAGRGPEGRVAFIAGKKLGGAVLRNRSKRVLRAAVTRAGGPWPGHDVVLIARPQTWVAKPEDIDEALANVLSRSGVTG